MITCYLKYIIDQFQSDIFEQYAKKSIELVNRFGGRHHGYFMPVVVDMSSDAPLEIFKEKQTLLVNYRKS
jgi:hypothetical protein